MFTTSSIDIIQELVIADAKARAFYPFTFNIVHAIYRCLSRGFLQDLGCQTS